MDKTPLTDLSEAELLTMLGRELLGQGIGFGPEDPGRYRRFAENWIDARMAEIRASVCTKTAIRALFDRDLQDRMNDYGALADALQTLSGHPPVALLSLILLRRGFSAVCGAA